MNAIETVNSVNADRELRPNLNGNLQLGINSGLTMDDTFDDNNSTIQSKE